MISGFGCSGGMLVWEGMFVGDMSSRESCGAVGEFVGSSVSAG